MSDLPVAYRGDADYAFACYTHGDSDVVFPLLLALNNKDIHTWYDEGIVPGVSWTDELANAIAGSHRVLFFISPASVASGYCLDEINYALENQIEVVCVFLEDTELPPGLKLSLNRRQAVMKHKLTDSAFQEKLEQLATPSAVLSAATLSRKAGAQRKPLVAALCALVLIAAASAIFVLQPWKSSEPSLLVVPFDALGLDSEFSYLPDAINNDLINRLAQTPDFKVIASVSARNIKETSETEQDMAERAGVEHLLVGSIQSTGNMFRVNARLIRAEDASIVWSKQYEGGLDNLFDIQASITGNIAEALELRFDEELLARMQDSGTDNIEAFSLSLKLQQLVQSGDRSRIDELVPMARQVVELDPNYANGWVQLGSLDHILNTIIGLKETDAEVSIDKALSLDPDNGVAMRIKSLILSRRDLEKAMIYANRAVELMPQDALAHTDRAIILSKMKRFDEAYTELQRAVTLDPMNPIPRMNLVDVLVSLDRTEEALVQANIGVGNQPQSPFANLSLAKALSSMSDPFAGLIETIETVEETSMPGSEIGLLMQLLLLDLPQAATSWNIFFQQRSPDNMIFGFLFGRIAKSSGDLEELRVLADNWKKATPDADFNKLDASILMMEANGENALNRELIYKRAYTLYQQAEERQPISFNPTSDLIYYIVLMREYGDPELAEKMIARVEKKPDYPTTQTERSMRLLLAGDTAGFLDELESQAQHGTLHIPFLKEVGVLGGNKGFYGGVERKPKLLKAIELQAKVNKDLALRAKAEYPRLMRPPTPSDIN